MSEFKAHTFANDINCAAAGVVRVMEIRNPHIPEAGNAAEGLEAIFDARISIMDRAVDGLFAYEVHADGLVIARADSYTPANRDWCEGPSSSYRPDYKVIEDGQEIPPPSGTNRPYALVGPGFVPNEAIRHGYKSIFGVGSVLVNLAIFDCFPKVGRPNIPAESVATVGTVGLAQQALLAVSGNISSNVIIGPFARVFAGRIGHNVEISSHVTTGLTHEEQVDRVSFFPDGGSAEFQGIKPTTQHEMGSKIWQGPPFRFEDIPDWTSVSHPASNWSSPGAQERGDVRTDHQEQRRFFLEGM